jgi:hypothetical protein
MGHANKYFLAGAVALICAWASAAPLHFHRLAYERITIIADNPPRCSYFEYSRTLEGSEWYPHSTYVNHLPGQLRSISMEIEVTEEMLWLRLTDCAGLTTENEQASVSPPEFPYLWP